MAWGALNELEDRCFKVPRHIAITDFDNVLSSIFLMPAITMENQHVFDIGKTAVSYLRSYDPGRKDTVFDAELVVRISCGCGGTDTIGTRSAGTFHSANHERKSDSGKPGSSETSLDYRGTIKTLSYFF
jgi:hypothetical protein